MFRPEIEKCENFCAVSLDAADMTENTYWRPQFRKNAIHYRKESMAPEWMGQ